MLRGRLTEAETQLAVCREELQQQADCSTQNGHAIRCTPSPAAYGNDLHPEDVDCIAAALAEANARLQAAGLSAVMPFEGLALEGVSACGMLRRSLRSGGTR